MKGVGKWQDLVRVVEEKQKLYDTKDCYNL